MSASELHKGFKKPSKENIPTQVMDINWDRAIKLVVTIYQATVEQAEKYVFEIFSCGSNHRLSNRASCL